MMPEERATLVAVYRTEGTNVEAEGPANKAVTGKTVLQSLKLELEKSVYYFFSYILYILVKFPCKDDNIRRFINEFLYICQLEKIINDHVIH